MFVRTIIEHIHDVLTGEARVVLEPCHRSSNAGPTAIAILKGWRIGKITTSRPRGKQASGYFIASHL